MSVESRLKHAYRRAAAGRTAQLLRFMQRDARWKPGDARLYVATVVRINNVRAAGDRDALVDAQREQQRLLRAAMHWPLRDGPPTRRAPRGELSREKLTEDERRLCEALPLVAGACVLDVLPLTPATTAAREHDHGAHAPPRRSTAPALIGRGEALAA